MADNTKIEWTDATANYCNGCSVLSAGCARCYAMRAGGRNLPGHPSTGLTKPTSAGHVWTGEIRADDKVLKMVLGWKRPRRIFWNAHGDLFHESVPDAVIDRQFAVMALTPQHVHQVLTKRPERMRAYVSDAAVAGRIARAVLDMVIEKTAKITDDWPVILIGTIDDPDDVLVSLPLRNVWLGTSVEHQAARLRLIDLAASPAAVRFVSGEPLIEGVSLTDIPMNGGPDENGVQWLFNALTGEQYFRGDDGFTYSGDGPEMAALDWVIVGGESGKGARPMHPDWARGLRDQCAAAGVPFFFKQWGNWAPVCELGETDELYHPAPVTRPDASRRCKVDQCVLHKDGKRFDGEAMYSRGAFWQGTGAMTMFEVGKAKAGRLLDGAQHNGVPA